MQPSSVNQLKKILGRIKGIWGKKGPVSGENRKKGKEMCSKTYEKLIKEIVEGGKNGKKKDHHYTGRRGGEPGTYWVNRTKKGGAGEKWGGVWRMVRYS